MSRLFNTVQAKFRKRNLFDLSYESRLTTDFGRLTPILCEPVLPNDRFRLSTNLRVQFAPMKFPVMQRYTAYVHYFFVPNRLLWKHWEEFITGGEDGLQTPETNPNCVYPTLKWDHDLVGYIERDRDEDSKKYFGTSSLYDYLGFPVPDYSDVVTPDQVNVSGQQLDALPFKAYQLIYNEWYRDQNLTEPIDILESLSGPHSSVYDKLCDLLTVRHRAWRKDYFTSALPDPQRGPDVTLPIVGDIDIVGDNSRLHSTMQGIYDPVNDPNHDHTAAIGVDANGTVYSAGDLDNKTPVVGLVETNTDYLASHLKAKIDETTGSTAIRSATINEVRRAFAVQRWYELAARAGSRYVEQILAHFGIRSSDARLQRPEYIGGSVVPVFIGDVLQTSESNETPLGTPAGVGQAAGHVKPITRTFEEHGWIIGILSVIPQAAYMQGMPRKYLKRDKFDFAWPLLANLGEQEIESQELYWDFTASEETNKQGFGYAPRYSEYKFGSGQVHGDFRTSLADFHGTRIFDSRPALNTEFIEVNAAKDGDDGLNRIFAVTDAMVDHLWVYLYNDIKVRRVLPKYGTPI